jgi:hypothetical protein
MQPQSATASCLQHDLFMPSSNHPILAGLFGAVVLNVLHEGARRIRGDAPRMDVVAGRAVRRLGRAVGVRPPEGRRLYGTTLIGDLVSNAAYYAAALAIGARGGARGQWLAATLSGLGAGAGAVRLPRVLGLGRPPHERRGSTRLMTVAWYLVGALAAATAARALSARERRADLRARQQNDRERLPAAYLRHM